MKLGKGPRGESVGLALGGDIAMNPQAMTLEQIREKGLAVLRKHLGIVGMVRFLQQAEMGSGNYTEERYQWLGDPDLEELAKKIQAHHPDRANLTHALRRAVKVFLQLFRMPSQDFGLVMSHGG
jgi:hypothetical protein